MDNEPAAGIFHELDRSCTVAYVLRSIRQLLSGLALAAALAAMPAAAPAHDDDGREPRELRDFDRDLDRDRDADLDRGRGRDRVDNDRSERSDNDREGRDGGDGDHEEDREEDRRGSNSGSNDSRDERRRARIDVERNERGGDRQRDEVLLIGPLGTADAVRGAGYRILSERRMDSLRQSLLRIQVRDRESVEQAVDTLRQRVPDIRAAPNHVFTPMGVNTSTTAIAAMPPIRTAAGARIGIIDTGADTSLASLRSVVRSTRGFAPGGYVARPHGSAVAQLASSQGATVDVADVFGLDARQRLVAPADAIAAAIDWLLGEKLQVLNISIEGPRNDVLEFVISEAIARGTAIVAAVGNGGPAAAPGYPAAYTGVIAVTALDENGVIYRRAARGKHVQFAAPGSFPGTGPPVVSSEPVSGTSFAAPLVAAELERRWRQRPGAPLDQILATLRAEARDLGKPGWDPIYGWGSIGARKSASAQ